MHKLNFGNFLFKDIQLISYVVPFILHCIMGNEPEIIQVEKESSETLLLNKILNSKCHNNVEAKNNDDQKNKRQDSPKKKNKGSRKRKYSSSSHESDSDSDEDSSSEDSDIDNDSSSESSKEEMPQDEHTPSRFSTRSSTRKKKEI